MVCKRVLKDRSNLLVVALVAVQSVTSREVTVESCTHVTLGSDDLAVRTSENEFFECMRIPHRSSGFGVTRWVLSFRCDTMPDFRRLTVTIV